MRQRFSHVVDADQRLCAVRLLGCAPWDLIDHEQEEHERDIAEGIRIAYVAATRARDLLVVAGVGDGPQDGWLGPLNKALYPQKPNFRASTVASACPPFGNASVLLRTERPGGGAATIRTLTDDEGRYDFNGIHPGKQLVRINANGFLRPDPIAFEMAEQDVVHDADVVVRPGYTRPLRLTHAGGAPATGIRSARAPNDRARRHSGRPAR